MCRRARVLSSIRPSLLVVWVVAVVSAASEIDTWLDQIKPGYSRFARAFERVGVEDLSDFPAIDAEIRSELDHELRLADAKSLQVSQILKAIDTVTQKTMPAPAASNRTQKTMPAPAASSRKDWRLPKSPGSKCPPMLIHIPKNGGTYTRAAWSQPWELRGLFSFEDGVIREPHDTRQKMTREARDLNCPQHHVPPRYFANRSDDPYRGKATWCVMRDPVSRWVSEFNYRRGHADGQTLQRWTEDYLKRFSQGFETRLDFVLDCHFVPQWAFVFANDSFTKRTCHQLVPQRNLSAHINEMRAACHLQPAKTDRHANAASKDAPTVKDLTPDLVARIKALYARDYELLGEYF